MKVNFVSISGKVFSDDLFIYGRSGKRYRIYTLYLNKVGWLKLITKENFTLPKDENIVVFGKIINVFGGIGIFAIEYRKVGDLKLY
ncbi:MAG: hypothetical protein ACP5PT_01590 [Brevinematia bacterium]